jgi:hypothetical protein
MARTRGPCGTTNGDLPSSVQIAVDERPAVRDRRRAAIPGTEEAMAWLRAPRRACVPLHKTRRFVISAVETEKVACLQEYQSQRPWSLRSLPPLLRDGD